MSLRRKPRAARPPAARRHTFIKFRRANSMKIAIEHRKASNTAVEFERLEIVNKRRRANETRGL